MVHGAMVLSLLKIQKGQSGRLKVDYDAYVGVENSRKNEDFF